MKKVGYILLNLIKKNIFMLENNILFGKLVILRWWKCVISYLYKIYIDF